MVVLRDDCLAVMKACSKAVQSVVLMAALWAVHLVVLMAAL
jgi:hypothetical protein